MADFDGESIGLQAAQNVLLKRYNEMAKKIKQAQTALEDCRLYWQMKHVEMAMIYMAEATEELKKAQGVMIGGDGA